MIRQHSLAADDLHRLVDDALGGLGGPAWKGPIRIGLKSRLPAASSRLGQRASRSGCLIRSGGFHMGVIVVVVAAWLAAVTLQTLLTGTRTARGARA